MTTATAPPLLDPPATPDAYLAPLLDDRERACELYDISTGEHCTNAATWMLACDARDYRHFRGPVLACTSCKDEVLIDGTVACPRVDCVLACYITWIEAIR